MDEHDTSPASALDLQTIRELLHLLSSTDVHELSIERQDIKLHIKRGPVQPPPHSGSVPASAVAPDSTGAPSVPANPTDAQPSDGLASSQPPAHDEPAAHAGHTLKAPIVGVFHAAASPTSEPLVHPGDHLDIGDTVCFIEALSVLHDIRSDVSGLVASILVQEGQTVEYGQPMMIIEPI